MTTLPPSIITTEELECEEWLLKVVDCELATLAPNAYGGLISELTHFSKELTALASSNQGRVKLLTDLKKKLIARMDERLSKTVYHLGGNA